MKKSPLLILIAACIGLAAFAQDQVMVCDRNEDGTCSWTQESPNPEVWLPSGLPGGADMTGSQEDVTVLIEWRAPSVIIDPWLNTPGSCARRPEFARYRFSAAMESNDLNRLIATYNWRGQTASSSEGLIEKISALPVSGEWERSVFSSSLGDLSNVEAPPIYWRWRDGPSISYFAMKQVEGCWFVEFASNPGESIVLRNKNAHLRDIRSPEPGVFEF